MKRQSAASSLGTRYGRLTAISIHGVTGKSVTLVRCACDCGVEHVARLGDLRSGGTLSCGCLQRERASEASRTHGQKRGGKVSPEYRAWQNMKTRCLDPRNAGYKNYGGRGITVCDRWLNSFEAFLQDMGQKPGPEYSIDRIDNSLSYNPDNCCWATRADQNRNTRRTKMLSFNGETLCLADWAERTGIPAQTLARRIARGWSLDRVFSYA